METEKEWVVRARQGDRSAFAELVSAYQNPVYNLAYRMTGNRSDAEEAAQETFLRVYANLHRYDPTRSFKSWILSIASHYCIDRLRRRRVTLVSLDGDELHPKWLAADCPDPERTVLRNEQEDCIQTILAQLGPVDRAAITLRYWYDCSYEEIAEALGLTGSAVKSRLHRARRKLADMIEDSGHDTL